MHILLLITGFVLLILSGNFLVKGAVSIARFYKISTLVIGATVVSLGTSAPELIVSVGAALKGKPDMALGNVIGSNISNIALVLGLTALVLPIPVRRGSIRYDWLIMMFASVLFLVFVITGKLLTRLEGIIMVSGLAAYVVWSIYNSRKLNAKDEEISETQKSFWFTFSDIKMLIKTGDRSLPLSLAFILVIISSIGLVYGAGFLVEGASGMARTLGVSERVIAVTVIALGTSIPELATSIMAAIKKEMDISIGNIIGSNIFNLLGILGITSIVLPIPLKDPGLLQDIIWMLIISFILILLIIPFDKKFRIKNRITCFLDFFRNNCTTGGKITRREGILLSLIYTVYIVLVFAFT
ncbi:MAG: calcium/sodium antiporter [Bacteroidota bacterium]|nr:calcium/sodium antiporter [Bacteroidota bacterium]